MACVRVAGYTVHPALWDRQEPFTGIDETTPLVDWNALAQVLFHPIPLHVIRRTWSILVAWR